MRWRELGWLTTLVGLPLSHLLLGAKIDLWHSQSLWMQAASWLLWAGALGEGLRLPPLRALGWWVAWTVLMSLLLWQRVVVGEKIYPALMLMPLVNVLTVLVFAQAALSTWTAAFLERLLRSLAWLGVGLVAYGCLQLLSLDQFFRNLDANVTGDVLVGTIGNPTHFAVQLVLLLPCLLCQPERWWRFAVLALLGLVVACQSAVGLLAGWLVVTLWLWRTRPRWGLGSFLAGGLGLCVAAWRLDLLDAEGRWAAWEVFGSWFAKRPMTGHGLGFVMEASRHITDSLSPVFQWRHVHNEWLQLAIEQGVVGVGLLLWLLVGWTKQFFHVMASPAGFACGLMVGALLLASLVSFPLHLWGLGAYGLVGFCGVLVLAQET